jgi:hypothetical protein
VCFLLASFLSKFVAILRAGITQSVEWLARKVRFPAEARDFSVFHVVETSSGAHHVFSATGIVCYFAGRKRSRLEADRSRSYSVEVKSDGAISLLPHPQRLHGVVLINEIVGTL